MSELLEKVVVVTQMKKIPTACAYCKYYENMGGNRGRGSDGVCTARGTLYATAFARLAGRFTRRGVSECRKSASIIARSA